MEICKQQIPQVKVKSCGIWGEIMSQNYNQGSISVQHTGANLRQSI